MGGWGWGASGFVDPEFEGHTASELVPLIVCGNIGSVDAAFNIHLHVGGHIQELYSHQRLSIVYMELFAIVGKVHQINAAISREHDKVAKVLSIFISLANTSDIHALVCPCIEVDDPIHFDEDTGLPGAVTIVGRVPNARAIAQLGPVELAGTFWVVQNPIIRLLIISPWTADIILLCLDGVVVRFQELVELLNMLTPAFSVTNVDNDIKVLSLGSNHQA